MHAAQDVRVLRCLDGLHYSFEMLKLIHAELHDACTTIAGKPDALVGALWRCWSFVDLIHRIRELGQAMPGLRKDRAELVVFLAATSIAEEYRNYIQHLRTELMQSPTNGSPVWGSLSWVDPNDSFLVHTAVFGAQVPGTPFGSCVFDRVEGRWVSQVALGTATSVFNFDPIFEAARRFEDFIGPWARNMYQGNVVVLSGPAIISTRLVFTNGDEEPQVEND